MRTLTYFLLLGLCAGLTSAAIYDGNQHPIVYGLIYLSYLIIMELRFTLVRYRITVIPPFYMRALWMMPLTAPVIIILFSIEGLNIHKTEN